uniref:Uncharacterized protein n=1 Tax=Labrus bergylta TaxID=56723 RepID=A0A3Q3EQY0_9LABR
MRIIFLKNNDLICRSLWGFVRRLKSKRWVTGRRSIIICLPMKGMDARESSSMGRGARLPFGLRGATSPVEPGTRPESSRSGENKDGSRGRVRRLFLTNSPATLQILHPSPPLRNIQSLAPSSI